MREAVQHLFAAIPDALRAAVVAAGEPGALDRVGALAIGLFVAACLLLAPAS